MAKIIPLIMACKLLIETFYPLGIRTASKHPYVMIKDILKLNNGEAD